MKYYVVWEGRAPGIYDTWEECQDQVEGFPGAKYKSYPDLESATEAYRGKDSEQMGIISAIARHMGQEVNYDAFPEIRQVALAVDCACSKNPGPVEYRGVWVATGEEVFRMGPFQDGTNNIGEFIALVHGLSYLDKIGQPDIPVYTDSLTARAWFRNRVAKTTLARTGRNQELFGLFDRAMAWARNHSPSNPILAWQTSKWGEIPADFGRK